MLVSLTGIISEGNNFVGVTSSTKLSVCEPEMEGKLRSETKRPSAKPYLFTRGFDCDNIILTDEIIVLINRVAKSCDQLDHGC